MSRAAGLAFRCAAPTLIAVGAALSLLGVAGCRDGGSAALPAPPASTRPAPPVDTTPDPLGGVESVLDDLEGDLDAGADGVPAR